MEGSGFDDAEVREVLEGICRLFGEEPGAGPWVPTRAGVAVKPVDAFDLGDPEGLREFGIAVAEAHLEEFGYTVEARGEAFGGEVFDIRCSRCGETSFVKTVARQAPAGEDGPDDGASSAIGEITPGLRRSIRTATLAFLAENPEVDSVSVDVYVVDAVAPTRARLHRFVGVADCSF